MDLKLVSVLVFVFTLCCVQNAVAAPRERILEKTDDLFNTTGAIIEDKLPEVDMRDKNPTPPSIFEDNHVTRRVCEFEEATETVACKQICLPKGYMYGLCVNYLCSCV